MTKGVKFVYTDISYTEVMWFMKKQDELNNIKKQIDSLPDGYISKKTINGKLYYYHQWTENGKKKSKYLRKDEAELLNEQIVLRRELQKKLNNLEGKVKSKKVFKTNIRTGDTLSDMVNIVRNMKKRELFKNITKYLYSNDYTRVCAVYGLRRTGKTTMLFQAIANMSDEEFAKTVYVKLRTTDTMEDIIHDLDILYKEGYKYIFIDEVTLMEDFIDSAAVFSDIFVPMGMRIILSGTDSLGFWFAEDNELYDRVRMIHTTFIPYREYSYLLGIDSIDEYIRYGGTLRMGEIDFDDDELSMEDASFRDDESTRKYIDTAICKNIQHSLACCENGNYFRHLFSLYEAGELTGAINRIIEDINHRFVLSVLTKDFKSHDLGISKKNLRDEKNPDVRTNILYQVDKETITKRLMNILEIKNVQDQKIGINMEHIAEIKQYLKALDLIIDCPDEVGMIGIPAEEHILFTQPGMRYCQAQALIYSLMKDEMFMQLNKEEKSFITERILEEVRGRMLEDIILLETSKMLGKRYHVFKLRFDRGEFDMVVCDRKTNKVAIYEIKHSKEIVTGQARHLLDKDKCEFVERQYGDIVAKYILYLGKSMNQDEGIAYRNVENYLENLPDFSLVDNIESQKEVEISVKALRKELGMNEKQFADYFAIPYDLLVEWEQESEHTPEYVLRLLEYYVHMKNKL